jgi:hypothetical protein
VYLTPAEHRVLHQMERAAHAGEGPVWATGLDVTDGLWTWSRSSEDVNEPSLWACGEDSHPTSMHLFIPHDEYSVADARHLAESILALCDVAESA